MLPSLEIATGLPDGAGPHATAGHWAPLLWGQRGEIFIASAGANPSGGSPQGLQGISKRTLLGGGPR